MGRLGRQWLALAVGAAVPFGTAAALVPFRTHIPNATVALLLAAEAATIAASATRLGAVIVAISAGTGFDVFHIRPYGTLTVGHAQDAETLALLLAITLVVGQLAARNRQHRRLAVDSAYNLGRVHGVAEMVASGAAVDQVLLAVANELTDLLRLKSSHFDPEFSPTPGPFIERQGALTWGALQWGHATTGLPAEEITLAIEYQGRPLGRYALLAEPGTKVTSDQLLAAVALADQAGAALAAQGVPRDPT